jgi:hypothetical protein
MYRHWVLRAAAYVVAAMVAGIAVAYQPKPADELTAEAADELTSAPAAR